MPTYIYEQEDWPRFRWDSANLLPVLSEVHRKQGMLLGKLDALGFDIQTAANWETLIHDVTMTSAIEGEILNQEEVRSSIANKLGIETSITEPTGRNVEGIVEIIIDATQNSANPLTEERLLAWHSVLFPQGRSGLKKISAGAWRTEGVQVVSGPLGREKIHFEGPPHEIIPREIARFLQWFNSDLTMDPLIKSATAHLWFITLHPFEDGNGRIARAIADMQLSRADKVPQRFYSMSSQIHKERKTYYSILEQTQKGYLDITEWIHWYLTCLSNTVEKSSKEINKIIKKHNFRRSFSDEKLNARQIIMLEKLLGDFKGNLTSSKWAKITGVSQDTALRDLTDLVAKGILRKTESGGRSSSYILCSTDNTN